MAAPSYPGPFEFLRAAGRCPCMSGSEWGVACALVVLVDNDTGAKSCAIAKIAELAHLSYNTAATAIAGLRAAGWLEVEHRKRRDGRAFDTSVYQLRVPDHGACAKCAAARPSLAARSAKHAKPTTSPSNWDPPSSEPSTLPQILRDPPPAIGTPSPKSCGTLPQQLGPPPPAIGTSLPSLPSSLPMTTQELPKREGALGGSSVGPEQDSAGKSGGEGGPTTDEPKAKRRTADVARVFEAYLAGWRRAVNAGKPPRLDDKRRKVIEARLRNFAVEDLIAACEGVWQSEFHMRGRHYGIDLVLRDTAHVERFIQFAPPPEPTTPGRGKAPSEAEGARRVLELFVDAWSKAHGGRIYAAPSADTRHAEQLWRDARKLAADAALAGGDGAPDEVAIVRHWVRSYLADKADRRLADAEHPLALLPHRVGPYGLPKPPRPAVVQPPPSLPSAPEGPPPPDLRQAAALFGAIGSGGSGGFVPRARRAAGEST